MGYEVEDELMLVDNETTGKIEVQPITETISHVDPAIVLLTIAGELIETTAEHPFYELESAPWLAVGQTEGRWTDALELKAGDRVWKADGASGVVQAVAVVPVQQPMYNLTVAEAHTFFVGDGQWLVHNCITNVFSGRKSMLNEMAARNIRSADGFQTIQNGKQFYTIDNQGVLDLIQETFGSTRDWVKVYEDGFDAAGNKVSLHYFHNSKTGQVWDGKIKAGWSNLPKKK